MSSKNSLTTVLGVVAATVIAGGGSAVVTDTGLRMLDKQNAIVQESEVAIAERETELPITVETFAETKDSFTVKPVSETENKKNSEKKNTGNKTSSSSDEKKEVSGEGSSEASTATGGSSASAGGSEANSESGSSSGGSKAAADSQPVSYDEWGGWTAANGDYYDGKGGYWDGEGYHYVGESIATPAGAASYWAANGSAPAATGYGSTGGGYSGGWDDSYILYDTSQRYISAGELSDWSAEELAIARNEIFARHGRIFVTEKWSNYFAQKTWYVPKYSNVDDLLNDYEWANLDVIMKLEEKYY